MLQKIHDSAGRWVALLVLGLVSVGFIFWRADFGTTGATFAAKVNGETVPINEFDRELQAQQSRFQQVYRTELSEDMRRELRRNVLENMIRDTVLKQRVADQGYRVSDQRVVDYIRSISAFQIDGEFSDATYRSLLQNQGYSPTGFEELQRRALEINDLEQGIADSSFLTPAEFRRYIELFHQRREVGYATFDVDAYLADVNVEDDAIAAHYEANKASYQTPETVDLEYVELSLADIAATIDVSDEALRRAYEEQRERFQTAEERHARHILIAVDDDDEAARAKAEMIAERAKSGEDFAALAKEFSSDAGTKDSGGDLGWVGRGTLVGPFEDALFGMNVKDVVGPVKTDFGYHVIELDEIRASVTQPFEEVRDELEQELSTERAQDQFYDRANQLEERAFDAYDDLASVAEALMLPLKKAEGFPRTGDPALFENSAPVVQAAFDEENLDTGRNSGLVELADDHVLVLRVAEHHVPMTKPLEEVHDQIKDELTRARAEELADKAANEFLAALEQGGDPAALAMEHKGTWHAPAWLERTNADVPSEVLAAAFGLAKPAAGAVEREEVALANGGHAVVSLTGVEPGKPEDVPAADREQQRTQLAQQAANAELTSYIGELRADAKVRVPDEVLNPQF